eukprot:994389_1
MCYNENKQLISYASKIKERKGTEDAQQADKLIKGILDDEDSMSVDSEIDFEFWDSHSDEDIKSNNDNDNDNNNDNNNDNDDEQSHTHTKSNSDNINNIDPQSQTIESESGSQNLHTLNTKQFQRKSAKLKRKSKNKLSKKQMQEMHKRSASLGCEQDLEPRHSSNRGIFSNSAKIFRLCYSHTPKKSTRTLYELANLSIGNGSINSDLGKKRDSESVSLDSNNSKANSIISPTSDRLVEDEKDNNTLTYDQYTQPRNSGLGHMNGLSQLSVNGLPSLMLNTSNVSNISISASPRNSGSSNRRLKIVGTGTLNIEAHQYDHELVSMRLHTFTEVIDWNLDPHSMKPKKKDDF